MEALSSKEAAAVEKRDRILIAAAVAAMLGKVRIREIRRTAWTRLRPANALVRRWNVPVETATEEEEAAS
jgi:hypothetical protein